MAKNGFQQRPRKKAINPIERDVWRSDQLGLADKREEQKRQIKYGPRGKMVPKSGTNETFE